ncbi:MAG TPA: primosomal protein N' [Candidatus Saccharimonadales bacterium]|nr:primosomal protein N' [Candidatus Saccharimonadales bacterium]
MQFVEVLVADPGYRGSEALTYGCESSVNVGQIVRIPLRKKIVLGIVTKTSTSKPKFAVKPLNEVLELPIIPQELIDLTLWMHKYYAAPLGTIMQQILPRDFPKRPTKPLPDMATEAYNLPDLTKDQTEAISQIGPAGMHILHGDTGTGKTRVYIELAKKSMAKGRSVFVLTPEIGLTSQLAADFKSIFGERVVVMHSQLSESVRQKLWTTVLKETKPVVIIGPRSILFSPVKNVGLIVLDEAHESAYKQDQSPYYHASHVAGYLANLHKSPLILGSATPLVTDYFTAQSKQRPVIRMTSTASGNTHGRRTITVDLRDKARFSRKSFLSDELIRQVEATLAKNEQVLLFLNRRGTARVILCDECGWQALCPHCDLPLTYHGDTHSIRCHSCEFRASPPTACPECGNTSVTFRSIGTKAVADEAQRLFPDRKIMRFDTDNKHGERLEVHYDDVKAGAVDILVGTQTLAKGLDLPKLGLVGVVIADTSLYVPDFSSHERTYQLLNQVIGRVGRGHRDSTVVVQTYSPESPLLRAALSNNWDLFYGDELREREQFTFPPFCYLAKLWCKRSTQKSAQKAAEKLATTLRHSGLRIEVDGPAPAFHEKNNNGYQWQLVLKAKNRSALLEALKLLPANWYHDIDPMNLL